MIVVDASVAAALFLPEAGSAAAERLVLSAARPDRLEAPDLLPMEVAAALTRRVGRGELVAADARAAMALLPRLGLRLRGTAELLARGIDLSLAGRHPLPDCLYLALAQGEGARLATFDRRLAAVAERLGIPLWHPEEP